MKRWHFSSLLSIFYSLDSVAIWAVYLVISFITHSLTELTLFTQVNNSHFYVWYMYASLFQPRVCDVSHLSGRLMEPDRIDSNRPDFIICTLYCLIDFRFFWLNSNSCVENVPERSNYHPLFHINSEWIWYSHISCPPLTCVTHDVLIPPSDIN